jgi:CBS domain containing-hemolysin-like protein/mannitol/fructose-specific phosphotransferase system IIA component (Ntr-type)
MDTLVLIAAGLILLGLNFFFVLAEFALVKVRPTRIAELVEAGDRRARLVQRIQNGMDEYLSVVQIGITGATLGVGLLIEPSIAEPVAHLAGLIAPGIPGVVVVSHVLGFLAATYLVIVTSELLPKSLALRAAEPIALRTALPMLWFHHAAYPLLWLLTVSARGLLRLLGQQADIAEQGHSEDELRIILDRSQSRGLLSFRRLLFIENVFDLGDLKVKDAMRPRPQIRMLHTALAWEDTIQFVRTWRFSRYPLITGDTEKPAGIVHLKDILFQHAGGQADLTGLARPFLSAQETQPLEQLLSEMQRRRQHVALVFNAEQRWTGMLTLEDVLEEIVGTISDEFETEDTIRVADVITPGRVVLDFAATSLTDAVGGILARVAPGELPLPAEQLRPSILERERSAPTYLGQGIAMPHARLPGLTKSAILFASSPTGVPVGSGERAHLIFILLTPAGAPRVHQRLQATIASMLGDSDYIAERLRGATSPEQVVDILRTGEQASLA